MKRLLFSTVILLLSILAKAQSFVCTDYNYYGSFLTPQKVQKEKAKFLGSKATLVFFDKSLKFSSTANGKTESIVLDKVNDNEYQIIERRGNDVDKMVLKLNKWVEYIRSFTIVGYKNNSLEGTLTYKRE